jgi:hypothetical protein
VKHDAQHVQRAGGALVQAVALGDLQAEPRQLLGLVEPALVVAHPRLPAQRVGRGHKVVAQHRRAERQRVRPRGGVPLPHPLGLARTPGQRARVLVRGRGRRQRDATHRRAGEG